MFYIVINSAAKVLDFIQTAWILDPSMFALNLINDNLDFVCGLLTKLLEAS